MEWKILINIGGLAEDGLIFDTIGQEGISVIRSFCIHNKN